MSKLSFYQAEFLVFNMFVALGLSTAVLLSNLSVKKCWALNSLYGKKKRTIFFFMDAELVKAGQILHFCLACGIHLKMSHDRIQSA